MVGLSLVFAISASEAPCAAVAFNRSTESVDSLAAIEPQHVRALDGTAAAGACAADTSAGHYAAGGDCFDLGIGDASSRWRPLAFMPRDLSAPHPDALSRGLRLQAALDELQHRGPCAARPTYTVAELPMIGTCATIEYAMLALATAASSGSRLILGRQSTPVWTSHWLCGAERSLGCYFNVSAACCPDDASFSASSRVEGAGDAAMAKLLQLKAAARGRKLNLKEKMMLAKLSKMGRADGMTSSRVDEKMKRRLLKEKTVRESERGKLGRQGMPPPGRELGTHEGHSAVVGSSRALTLGGSLAEHNEYGTLWVSGQLVHWLFEQMRPGTRAQLDARRADVFPRAVESAGYTGTAGGPAAGGARALTIGMHVRRGDSCALGSRFCPRNKTAAYFEMAARLRAQYPAMQRLVVATDDAEAAALCASRVLGFECLTRAMDRTRFQSQTSIERRVVKHAHGLLSGATVTLDALADLEMLADCDAHVLVFRSALSRLAYALSTARKGRFTPLISVQWPWGGMPGPSSLGAARPAASRVYQTLNVAI